MYGLRLLTRGRYGALDGRLSRARWKPRRQRRARFFAAFRACCEPHEHSRRRALEQFAAVSSMADISRIVLVVDGVEFITTQSMEKAMDLLLGAFFIFNIAYPRGCPLTMEFLHRYFGQINTNKNRGGGKGEGSGMPPRLLGLLRAL
ncbi:hypothetical protein HPB50_012156 [Hyalomma asiaticum]|uniref:Uncharacterized protein n=1 Tax=Hyalomma asiaticum TaxID=266040 RepID=A0ACB7RW83_HYAAI|nr:hypothetical protein HPB50_012156 [Hyalomma asiaticum]